MGRPAALTQVVLGHLCRIQPISSERLITWRTAFDPGSFRSENLSILTVFGAATPVYTGSRNLHPPGEAIWDRFSSDFLRWRFSCGPRTSFGHLTCLDPIVSIHIIEVRSRKSRLRRGNSVTMRGSSAAEIAGRQSPPIPLVAAELRGRARRNR